MFNISYLRYPNWIQIWHVIIILLFLFPLEGFNQDFALVNNGCHIYTQGTGNQNTNPTISILGSFKNLNDGTGDGTIEQEASHIWISGDWVNDANNQVFTNFIGFNNDGFVTFQNPNNLQNIEGLNPTNFENVILKQFRKQLNTDNVLTQGFLELDAVFVLNGNNFIINNPNPLSMDHVSGFIKSETLPGNYGTIQWNIGSGLGSYVIPFGTDNFAIDDLMFTMDIKSAMGTSDHVKFATYPSDIYNNPLPLNSSNLELEPFKVVDRYWIIEPSDPNNNPQADLTFTYSSTDVASGFNNLNLQTLKASRNNTTLGQWLDMIPRGSVSSNTVTIEDVLPSEFFAPWTLVNIPGPLANVFVPDAFTPDGDGLNDEFAPVFQVDFEIESYEFYIFDRWGNVMFNTKDPNAGWNGKKNNIEGDPVNGVYTWMIIVKGYNYEFGNNLLRDRLRGRVTLFR
jgi:gliding motility-associated-like protein